MPKTVFIILWDETDGEETTIQVFRDAEDATREFSKQIAESRKDEFVVDVEWSAHTLLPTARLYSNAWEDKTPKYREENWMITPEYVGCIIERQVNK